MSNGRKILFVVSFIVIDLLLLGSIFVIRDFTGKRILENEVNALVELDFSKDNYNTEIKSSGDYAVLEKAIKKYLDDYATEVQYVLRVRYDQELNNMLDIDNIIYDGPMFNESIEYVDLLQNNFNYSVDLLMDRVSTEEINKYIYNYDVDNESIELYSNLLLKSNLISKIEENQLSLTKKRIEINGYIDSIKNVLVFLKNNSYSVIDGEVIMTDPNMQEEYYKLISETKRIY